MLRGCGPGTCTQLHRKGEQLWLRGWHTTSPSLPRALHLASQVGALPWACLDTLAAPLACPRSCCTAAMQFADAGCAGDPTFVSLVLPSTGIQSQGLNSSER